MALYMNGQEISQSSGVPISGAPISGATEPYIEEIYNSDGQLISANMHGYDAIRSYMFSGLRSGSSFLIAILEPDSKYVGAVIGLSSIRFVP